jgi:hypothetical protein
LGEYHRLYLTRQNELLHYAARLGDSDKTVFTAWEVNFQQVTQESVDASNILLLFSFLEGSSIPEVLLHRGTSPQNRWSEAGEAIEVTAEDEGVDGRLIRAIQGDFGLIRPWRNYFPFH